MTDILPLLEHLEQLQNSDSNQTLFGNYRSERYHLLFPIRRVEDNVYFVSWINQSLRRNSDALSDEERLLVTRITSRADTAITAYRNRYGEETYNFYRPKAWFPNGRFLSRYVLFQPTDDADDTSIAMRGRVHEKAYAQRIKEIYIHQSNGKRGRWTARIPRKYRAREAYNTWIGSEKLYVDIDLVVLSNILIFNAQYELGMTAEDEASIQLIVDCVNQSEYLKKRWSLSAWYPVVSSILYSLADLLSYSAYPKLEVIRPHLIKDIQKALEDNPSLLDRLLLKNALMKLGEEAPVEAELTIDSLTADSERFTFGVIPLLHPFDGLFMQYMSRYKLFKMHYRCDAQAIAIAIEHLALSRKKRKSGIL